MSARISDTGDLAPLVRESRKLKGARFEAGFMNLSGDVAIYAPVQEYGVTIQVTPAMRGFFLAKGFPLSANTTEIVIPATAPIRLSFDDPRLMTAVMEALQNGVDALFAGTGTVKEIVHDGGQAAAEFISEKIKSGLGPEQHPLTLQEKPGTTRLIKTGELLGTVGHAPL